MTEADIVAEIESVAKELDVLQGVLVDLSGTLGKTQELMGELVTTLATAQTWLRNMESRRVLLTLLARLGS